MIRVGLDLVIDALIYRQEHLDIQRIVAAEAQEVRNINKEDIQPSEIEDPIVGKSRQLPKDPARGAAHIHSKSKDYLATPKYIRIFLRYI